MANRYNDWQQDLSVELVQSKKRRVLFFKGLQEEYNNDLEALRVIVKIIGLKEYSLLCNLKASNLSNYLKKGKDLKISTIEKLLSPFGVTQINISLNSAA